MYVVLPNAGYLLVTTPPLPYLLSLASMEPMVDYCSEVDDVDIAIRRDRFNHTNDASGLLLMRWSRCGFRHVVIFFVDLAKILFGGDLARSIQRSWRRNRRRRLEERRLALCMGTHPRLGSNPWLDVVLSTLCASDLERLF